MTYHLSYTETVSKIMKGNLVVVLVGLVEEVAEDVDIDGELGTEIQIEVHLLQK